MQEEIITSETIDYIKTLTKSGIKEFCIILETEDGWAAFKSTPPGGDTYKFITRWMYHDLFIKAHRSGTQEIQVGKENDN